MQSKMIKTKGIKELLKQYEFVCNEIVSKFCKKQDCTFIGWVGDEIGEVACFDDFILYFRDIVWDVNSKQPKGLIKEWIADCVEMHPKYINYYAYSKGLRSSDLDDKKGDKQ